MSALASVAAVTVIFEVAGGKATFEETRRPDNQYRPKVRL